LHDTWVNAFDESRHDHTTEMLIQIAVLCLPGNGDLVSMYEFMHVVVLA